MASEPIQDIAHIGSVELLSPAHERSLWFFRDVLGMEIAHTAGPSVWLRGFGDYAAATLKLTAAHHEVAYLLDLKRGQGRLHHLSLWVDNREDVLRAADILSENGVFIEVGPSKHNNSQGFSLYCYEPGGNRIEVHSGSFLVFAPDWEVVTSDEQERGSGMYWGSALPDSFRRYATPSIDVPVPVHAPKLPVFF